MRDGRASDWPLLCTSFANYYCKNPGSYYGYRVPPHTLVTKLEQFRDSPDWKLIAACPDSNHDEVMGMLVYRYQNNNNRNPALAWITVKPLYQRKGVAKALLQHAGVKSGDVDCAFLLQNVVNRRLSYKNSTEIESWEFLGVLTDWARQHRLTLRFRPYLPDVELWNELQANTEAK